MYKSYHKIVGTGGIGTGMLFQSLKVETLGRSESRPVLLSDAKDYCKQHIVLHYAAVLGKKHAVIPIGFVGQDSNGEELLAKMEKTGMDISYIGKSRNLPTMLSICLQYPDKEGCNFTAVNNAMQEVTPQYIEDCMQEIGIDRHTLVAAIPEVSVESRLKMLQLGRENGAYCVLSVPVSEADEFWQSDAFENSNLLAVNEEEAMAIAKSNHKGKQIAEELFQCLEKRNTDITLLVTCGGHGSYTVHKGSVEFIPALKVNVVNTTGAGDACLGGILAGMMAGLPLQKGINDHTFGETTLKTAVELGILCAGMSVEDEDSISWNVNRKVIHDYILEKKWKTDWLKLCDDNGVKK